MGLKAVATLVPGGGAPVGGSGTPGTLAKFTGAGTSIGDSAISESGILISINAGVGTNMVINDGTGMAGPSYDGVRLCRGSEALFSSSDSVRTFRAGVTGATVVAGSTTSHDLLLQRGNVTALTLGASGAVTFAGSLTSSAAQTWTLAAGSTSALNIASNLLNLDTTNSRVGVGTASPFGKLDVAGTTVNSSVVNIDGSLYNGSGNGSNNVGFQFFAQNSSSARTQYGGISMLNQISTAGTEKGRMRFFVANSGDGAANEAMTILGSNVGIGTTSPGFRLDVVGAPSATAARLQVSNSNTAPALNAEPGLNLKNTTNASGVYTSITNRDSVDNPNTQINFINVNQSGSGAINFVTRDSATGFAERVRIDSTGNLILGVASGVSIQAAGTNQGLKLATTPGNTDPNTLDSYREGTRVLAAGDLSGWTFVTATQYWTLVGRTVTLHTIFTGGTSSATGGATIATPLLLTPLRIAAGAAVNSSGTALGNGVCVVASTSSTTGTVTTSSAISSSALDKVITVTYETAGL